MIFVARLRAGRPDEDPRTDSWASFGPLHLFIGDDPSSLRAPCGAEVEILPNEVHTLLSHPSFTDVEWFEGNPSRCPRCARWLREHRAELFAAEKMGEKS